MKKGFTLIELLVVVLIIGILSAVALPQYQKSVEKARISQLYVLLSAIDKAQSVHFMENGSYAENFVDLGVQLPFDDTDKLYFNGGDYLWKKWASYKGLMGCRKYQNGYYCMQVEFANHRIACMEQTNKKLNGLCASFGFTKKYLSGGEVRDLPAPIGSTRFDYYEVE